MPLYDFAVASTTFNDRWDPPDAQALLRSRSQPFSSPCISDLDYPVPTTAASGWIRRRRVLFVADALPGCGARSTAVSTTPAAALRGAGPGPPPASLQAKKRHRRGSREAPTAPRYDLS